MSLASPSPVRTARSSQPRPTDESTTTGGELDPACQCVDAGGCSAKLCDDVGLHCEQDCPADHPVDDEAALQCALEALRDRTPGKIGWVVATDFGQFSSSTDVFISGDGHALVRRSGDADLCSYTGPDSAHALADAAYFTGCLALASGRERWDCMLDDVLAELATCAPEESACGDIQAARAVRGGVFCPGAPRTARRSRRHGVLRPRTARPGPLSPRRRLRYPRALRAAP